MTHFPLTDEMGTPDGVGRYNHFSDYSIYWTPSTGAHFVAGVIRNKWTDLGLEKSFLGYPTSKEYVDQIYLTAARYQEFQRGAITWAPLTEVHEIQGAIYAKWREKFSSRLGFPVDADFPDRYYPVTGETATPDKVGRFNHFADLDSIYWSPATGAHYVGPTIRKVWSGYGWEAGVLGYPTSDTVMLEDASSLGEAASFTKIERCEFQNGAIYNILPHAVAKAPGKYRTVLYREIYKKFVALGGLFSIGIPWQILSAADGGLFCQFRKHVPGDIGQNAIYWHPSIGAHAVLGAIHSKWLALGGELGKLGYPVSDEAPWYEAPGGRYSDFQRGRIVWDPKGGARLLEPPPPPPKTVTVDFFLDSEDIYASDPGGKGRLVYRGVYPGSGTLFGVIESINVPIGPGYNVTFLVFGTGSGGPYVSKRIPMKPGESLTGSDLLLFTDSARKNATVRAYSDQPETSKQLRLSITHTGP